MSYLAAAWNRNQLAGILTDESVRKAALEASPQAKGVAPEELWSSVLKPNTHFPTEGYDMQTPLHAAALAANMDAAEALLEQGADPNVMTIVAGLTPGDVAEKIGAEDLAKRLRRAGSGLKAFL